MSELSLSSNLAQLMRIHGNISVSDLARLTNIPQPTLHHILTGSTKNPRRKALSTLADFFSISIDQLVGDEPLPTIIPESVKENLKLKTVPVIEWDMLKSWPTMPTNNEQQNEILIDKEISNNSFAWVIPDSSMEPLFPQNALLIFDAGKRSVDRDYVIVHMNRNNQVVFNRLFIDKNENYIKQDIEDGNVSLIKLDMSVDRIIGTLTEVRIQY